MPTPKRIIGQILRLPLGRRRVVIALLALSSLCLGAHPNKQVSADQRNVNEVGHPPDSTGITKSFEVATIRRSSPESSGWRMEFTLDGFTAKNVTLRQLIQPGFGIFEEDRLTGGPTWIDSTKFDVEAKVDSSLVESFANLSLADRQEMLMVLLADRFKLRAHRVTKVVPVFELVVVGAAPKMQETKPEDRVQSSIKGIEGLVTRSSKGELEVRDYSMASFAQYLSLSLNRQVIDRTELTQRYSFSLHWPPDEMVSQNSQDDLLPPAPSGSSIFSAIQQQLGLKLRPSKSPIDAIVVDQAQTPTAN